jgi:hypothetical protein
MSLRLVSFDISLATGGTGRLKYVAGASHIHEHTHINPQSCHRSLCRRENAIIDISTVTRRHTRRPCSAKRRSLPNSRPNLWR